MPLSQTSSITFPTFSLPIVHAYLANQTTPDFSSFLAPKFSFFMDFEQPLKIKNKKIKKEENGKS
jgi:hypothetical protein